MSEYDFTDEEILRADARFHAALATGANVAQVRRVIADPRVTGGELATGAEIAMWREAGVFGFLIGERSAQRAARAASEN